MEVKVSAFLQIAVSVYVNDKFTCAMHNYIIIVSFNLRYNLHISKLSR